MPFQPSLVSTSQGLPEWSNQTVRANQDKHFSLFGLVVIGDEEEEFRNIDNFFSSPSPTLRTSEQNFSPCKTFPDKRNAGAYPSGAPYGGDKRVGSGVTRKYWTRIKGFPGL